MPTVTDIRRVLRDHVRFTGDGQPNAPVGAPLPVGDPRSGMYNLDKYELRELLIAILQTQGDPDALQTIIADLNEKADRQNSGKVFTSRTAAVGAGQSALPGSLGIIFTVEGANNETLAVRSFNNATEDPLFATQPRWGVAMRVPNILAMNGKADRADVESLVRTYAPGPSVVPLYSDGVGNVPVWLTDGQLDAAGMAPTLRDKAVSEIAPKVRAGSRLIPILGAGGQVLIWADESGLIIPGLARQSELPSVPARPSITDGRSLHRARMKLAKIAAGTAEAKLKIAGIGDSWWEMPQITRAFRTYAEGKLGLSGEGFRPAAGGNTVGPTTWTRVGWTDVDGSDASPAFTYGAGPDGNAVYSTLTTSTMALAGIVATEIRIYTYQHGGTWRYRVDGGSWVTVIENGSGAFRVTAISALADAAHTLEIDTLGNAGTVSMAGIYSTRAISGVEVLKFGNGGTRGDRVLNYAQFLTAPMADMQPDVAVVILGTNDYRSVASPPAVYLAALQAIVAASRAAVPDIGFVFVIPPQTSGVPVNPLSAYRDIVQPWADAQGHEVVSLLDRWSDYETANAHGLFADTLHVNSVGAGVLTADILTNLILKGQ